MSDECRESDQSFLGDLILQSESLTRVGLQAFSETKIFADFHRI